MPLVTGQGGIDLSASDKQAFEHLRPTPDRKFKIGDRVILHGFKGTVFNGKPGEISRWSENQGRYAVKVPGEQKLKWFLPANIKIDDGRSDNNSPISKQADKAPFDSKAKARPMQNQSTRSDESRMPTHDPILPNLRRIPTLRSLSLGRQAVPNSPR